MDSQKQIRAFSKLGDEIQRMILNEDKIIDTAYNENGWFVPLFVKNALQGLTYMLKEEKLFKWLSHYPEPQNGTKNIGIIMAGNIPLVGFHDLLTVICSKNRAIIKLSHKDNVLIPYIAELLEKIDPSLKHQIVFEKSLNHVDAVIATGSDNTSRFFAYTFRNIPRLIRKNRSSCCVLDGNESSSELEELSKDIFSYFGMGCRNVSKIYVPEGFDTRSLFPHFTNYSWIKNHSKYYHNYSFQSARLSLEKREFVDGQFFILLRDQNLISPLACLHYEKYENQLELETIIADDRHKIQCIVSRGGSFPNSLYYGMAQFPEPWDYADNVDIIDFLSGI